MEAVEKLSAEEAKSLEERVSVPYRVEDVTVLSPGQWNGLNWTASELRQAVERTDFDLSRERGDERPPNSSLFFNHEDRSADKWIGNVENVRVTGDGDVVSDLVITDKQLAMNLEYGAPFGVSPKADGLIDEDQKMQEFSFENFSMVVNPAVKTTWLNEDIEQVLQDMEIHDVSFSGTTEGEWDSPNLEDFTDESWSDMSSSEKRAVGRHFLISKTGFPADNYTDLALPVVQPNGDLNLRALRNAKARVSQVSGIDEDAIARVSRMINNLANGNFESADFSEVDMSENGEGMTEDEDVPEDKREMEDDGDGSEEAEDGTNNSNEDIKVKTSMAEEQEQEPEQEPEADESPDGEESVENSDDYVTADQLEDFKSNLMSELKQELADGDDDDEADEEAEDAEGVEEVEEEASDEELSEFEEFRQENPDMTLSEAAKEFEEQNRDVEDKIEEMSQKFSEKIDELESKLESKEEEVEELSEKVSNPQRATQAGDDGDEDLSEKVSNLSDDELHAQIFQQLDSKGGVSATKEMMHNG